MNELRPIATVSWEELRQYVYETDGSWRDIYVLNASSADWKIWMDFVNANYRVVFTDGDGAQHNQIDFATVESDWNSHGQANVPMATFFVGEIGINCHFLSADKLENDLDPQKINSAAAHQQLMDFLVQLSLALKKEVVLTWENDPPAPCSPHRVWPPLLAVNGAQIEVNTYWRGSESH